MKKTFKNLKIIGILAMALGIGFLISKLNRDPKPSQDLKLEKDDLAKVLIKKNKVTIVKHATNGTFEAISKYVPKHAVISIKKDGSIDVNVQEFGWSTEPGIGTIATREGLALSLDLQVMYWKRMGLNVGTGVRLGVKAITANEVMRDGIRPFIAVTYRLPFEIVSNTSVLIGYQPLHQQICAGVRVQF